MRRVSVARWRQDVFPSPLFTGRGNGVGWAPLPETLHALSRPHREPHPLPSPKNGEGRAAGVRSDCRDPIGGGRRVSDAARPGPGKAGRVLFVEGGRACRKSSGGLTSAATGKRCNQTSSHRGRPNRSSGRMNMKRPTRELRAGVAGHLCGQAVYADVTGIVGSSASGGCDKGECSQS